MSDLTPHQSDDGHDHANARNIEKAKGKEKEFAVATPGRWAGWGRGGEVGGKKKKNSYKHLIKGVPGGAIVCATLVSKH